ncbi:hypothetical protein P3480_25115 [Vibrio parahaemolyticus]|nr:hypothetical protein [Vibrio parahaemolyticus]
MGVAAQQGEVSTDPAWRSDSFVPKGFAEGALKARQLKPGLLSAQAERSWCSGSLVDRWTVHTRHQNLTGRFPECQAH